MRLMKIAAATATTMTLSVLTMNALFLLCCYRIGATSAWVASSNVVGCTSQNLIRSRSGASSYSQNEATCSTKKQISSFQATTTITLLRLVGVGQRHKRVSAPLTFKAASSSCVEINSSSSNNNNSTIHNLFNTTQGLDYGISSSFSLSSSSSILGQPTTPEQLQEKEEEIHFTPEQKITNLVVLSLAFGYALYTILSIDGGATRGWSASEIAMRIPLDNWGAYESYLENKPIVTKSLINVIIYLLGDWLSQTAFNPNNDNNDLLEFDLQRTLRNGFIGLCFGPLVHAYYEFSDSILPPENGLLIRLQKILMDQTIYLTVKCCVYISAVGLLAGEDRESVFQTVKDKIGGIVVTAWKFWPIIHCVTYSVIPAQHRVLWVNSVDLVWNAILSSAAQKGEETETSSEQNIQIGIDCDQTTIEAPMIHTETAPLVLQTEADIMFRGRSGGQTNTTNSNAVAWVGA